MLYFSKLRILSIALFSSLFILIALTNLFKIDDDFFDKKINLGLNNDAANPLSFFISPRQ